MTPGRKRITIRFTLSTTDIVGFAPIGTVKFVAK